MTMLNPSPTGVPAKDLSARLQEALAVSQSQNLTLDDALAWIDQTTSKAACQILATHFHLPCWDHEALGMHRPIFQSWPLSQSHQTHCVLVEDPNTLQVYAALTNPLDVDLITRVEFSAARPVQLVLATKEDIHAYLKLQETLLRAIDGIHPSQSPLVTDIRSDVEILTLAAVSETSSAPVRLVNSTLFDALRAGASDVHMESTPTGVSIKYRIDGVLDAVTDISGSELCEQVISRIKVMADLDIAERRVPQDGSFQVGAMGRIIDLRVSIMPSIHGEDAVIRILDKQALIEAHGQLSLDALGFDNKSITTLRDLAGAAYGMLLVTGPTGSGKTTTLYAALSENQTGKEKTITIEDPVEYQLPGVLQIPVNEKKGLTFARGLRSILRHDPDRIMVGEIRDKDTAEIAVQSALTGHLVMSTVHANSVFDVFSRFTHMGLDTYALVSALNGIWAQRLIRVNCPSCSKPHDPSQLELDRFGITAETLHTYRFTKGSGCGDCRGTGYRGRRAIAEILQLDDEIKEMIVERRSMRTIKEAARKKGGSSLQDAALALVQEGLTTLEEVKRVTLSL